MEDITEFLELDNQLVEVENCLAELEKQRENHAKLNDELMPLLEEDDVDVECEDFAEFHRTTSVSFTIRLKNILQIHITPL